MPDAGIGHARVATLAAKEHERVADLLARAFRDNPINRAVIGSSDPARRHVCNLHGMRSLIPAAVAGGEVLVARWGERAVGALVSTPPGAYPLPASPFWPRLRCIWGQGVRTAARWGRVFVDLDAAHPAAPSWYLGTLGVDPEFQGRGVGSTLLGSWLHRVDRARGAAYLETDLRQNVAFYARAGFAPLGEIEVLGVPVWRMWRPAASAISTAPLPQ